MVNTNNFTYFSPIYWPGEKTSVILVVGQASNNLALFTVGEDGTTKEPGKY